MQNRNNRKFRLMNLKDNKNSGPILLFKMNIDCSSLPLLHRYLHLKNNLITACRMLATSMISKYSENFAFLMSAVLSRTWARTGDKSMVTEVNIGYKFNFVKISQYFFYQIVPFSMSCTQISSLQYFRIRPLIWLLFLPDYWSLIEDILITISFFIFRFLHILIINPMISWKK